MSRLPALEQALQPYSPVSKPEAFGLDGVTPSLGIAPIDPGAMASAVKLIGEAGGAAVPWGGGVQQGLGFLPGPYDVALSTANMTRLVDLQPGDLTITVEAGMTLGAVQDLLGNHRQFVALESADPHRETIGGILASGSSALMRYSYGPPRDQVIGVAVAMPDGSVVRGGGRVVKNVAGYDLCKLFTGSMGTLGVIVEATFRVRPMPAATRTWIGLFSGWQHAEEGLAALMSSTLQPTFIQIMDSGLIARIGAEISIPGLPVTDTNEEIWAIAIGADGNEPLSRWMCEEATHLAGAGGCDTLTGADSSSLRSLLTRASGAESDLAVRISVPGGDLLGLLAAWRSRCRAAADCSTWISAAGGNGTGFVNLNASPASGRDIYTPMVEWAADRAASLKGSCRVQKCPAEIRSRIPMWGRPPQGWALMKKIRDAFDPGLTLNRGRLFREEVGE